MHGRSLALQSHSPGFLVNQAHSVNSVVYEYKLCAESNVEVQVNWPPYHIILNLGTHNYQQKCLLGCGTNFENDRTCLLVYTILNKIKTILKTRMYNVFSHLKIGKLFCLRVLELGKFCIFENLWPSTCFTRLAVPLYNFWGVV